LKVKFLFCHNSKHWATEAKHASDNQKMGFEDVGYIGVAQGMSQYACVRTVMNVLSSFKAAN